LGGKSPRRHLLRRRAGRGAPSLPTIEPIVSAHSLDADLFIGASPNAPVSSAADHTVLSLKNVQVLYDRAIEAVRDVSLDVPGGAIVALLGSNGAGKSTILKAISGVLAQEDGEIVNGSVHLDGAPISGRSPREIVRALQVPEARNLLMGGFTRTRAECAQTLERIYALFPRIKERR
jgi:ABC-type multidrug transport system fused ATPase/permease subunit